MVSLQFVWFRDSVDGVPGSTREIMCATLKCFESYILSKLSPEPTKEKVTLFRKRMVFHHAPPVKVERCGDGVFPLEITQKLSSGRELARAGPGKDTGFLRAVPSGRGSPGWLAWGWAVGGGRGSLLDPSCDQTPCRDWHAQATPQARVGGLSSPRDPRCGPCPDTWDPGWSFVTSVDRHMDTAELPGVAGERPRHKPGAS